MIDIHNARRINRLRWLSERVKFYREQRFTFARLTRCARLELAIEEQFRLGGLSSVETYSDFA
jgi:hypothetical protein